MDNNNNENLFSNLTNAESLDKLEKIGKDTVETNNNQKPINNNENMFSNLPKDIQLNNLEYIRNYENDNEDKKNRTR